MANFDTVYLGIADLLKGLSYSESSQAVDFKDAPSTEYGNTFILKCLSGEMGQETIVDRFYDNQTWQVQIAISKSEQSDVVQLGEVHRKKDTILKTLDKPANWESFVKILKYKIWDVIEEPNYYILDIKLEVLDTYTY